VIGNDYDAKSAATQWSLHGSQGMSLGSQSLERRFKSCSV